MQHFKALIQQFAQHFDTAHFPEHPLHLYQPCDYFLSLGGKRIRPVLCLLGNDLFAPLHPDVYELATAVELFHNFTLIHDDIMDDASLRRGMETVHTKYGTNVALLSGDVMLIRAYEYINRLQPHYLQRILTIFNTTAKQVCEGQQLDMDFEKYTNVSFDEYVHMIGLKTSVLLAGSLEMGGIIGGASDTDLAHLYQFGLNLGIAFQIQDDYLDAFGNPETFGKEVGGDIKQNKKTFLLIHALDVANAEQRQQLYQLMEQNPPDKVAQILSIFTACNVDAWANSLKENYLQKAYAHLEAIQVAPERKIALQELAAYLIVRVQ